MTREPGGVQSHSPAVSKQFLKEEMAKLALKDRRSVLGWRQGKGVPGRGKDLGKAMKEARRTSMCSGNCKMLGVAGA